MFQDGISGLSGGRLFLTSGFWVELETVWPLAIHEADCSEGLVFSSLLTIKDNETAQSVSFCLRVNGASGGI